MNKTFAMVAAFTVAAVMTVPIAAAGQHGPPQGGPPGMGQDRMGPPPPMQGPPPLPLDKLKLSEEQRTAIRQITDAQMAQSEPMMQKLKQAEQQMTVLVFTEQADEAQVAALQRTVLSLQSQALASHVALGTKIAQVLTAEQRAQLITLIRQQRPPAGRGEGRGRGPGI